MDARIYVPPVKAPTYFFYSTISSFSARLDFQIGVPLKNRTCTRPVHFSSLHGWSDFYPDFTLAPPVCPFNLFHELCDICKLPTAYAMRSGSTGNGYNTHTGPNRTFTKKNTLVILFYPEKIFLK